MNRDGLAGLVVVPDRRCHREDALRDTYGNTFERASAMKLQVKLAFESVVDLLPQAAECSARPPQATHPNQSHPRMGWLRTRPWQATSP